MGYFQTKKTKKNNKNVHVFLPVPPTGVIIILLLFLREPFLFQSLFLFLPGMGPVDFSLFYFISQLFSQISHVFFVPSGS